MSTNMKKRLERMSNCVKENDVPRLKHYIRRKKYNKLHLNEIVINKRGETLLHLACRLCKPQITSLLLVNGLGDPTAEDSKGNTALHLALKSVMEIDQKDAYISAYRNLILAHLRDLSVSLPFQNFQGQTANELLELADSVYKYHQGKSNQTNSENDNNHLQSSEDQEWTNKLAAELDDEYGSSWGKYENDYVQPDTDETETYDSWAKRIIYEYKKKTKPPPAPTSSKSELKSSTWTEEDQRKFIQEEEKRKQQQKSADINNKRLQFLSQLRIMVQSESQIQISDLPFDLSENVDSICQLILLHVKEIEEVDAKRKALRELRVLWHPDKFTQKFGLRLYEEIRDDVLKKVTEISQYLNTFNFQSAS